MKTKKVPRKKLAGVAHDHESKGNGIGSTVAEKRALRANLEALLPADGALQMFQLLADTTSAAIFMYGGDHLRFVNHSAEEVTGYPAQQLLQMKFWEVIDPEFLDIVRSRGLARQRGELVPNRYTVAIRTRDGRRRWLDFTGTAFGSGNRSIVLGIAFDITERVELKEKLERALSQLEKRVKERTAQLLRTNRELNAEIARRKSIEAKLRISEEKFSKAFLCSPGALSISSLKDGRLIEVNDAYLNFYGLTREEALGHTVKELQIWENWEDRKQMVKMLQEQGTVRNLECRVRKKSGEQGIVQASVDLFELEGQQYLIAIVNDITNQVRAETALRESEERYRTLVEQASEGIFVVDGNGRFVEMNTCGCTLVGKSREQILQTAIGEVLFDKDHDRPLELSTLNCAQQLTAEFRLKNASGKMIPVELSAVALPKKRVQGIMRDITGRKRMEKALRESEKKYRQLVENAQDGIWAIDDQGRTTYANRRMEEMLGLSPGEMTGKHLFSFMDEAGIQLCKINLDRRRKGISERHDFELLHKNGSRVYVSMETSPIEDEDGRYVGALACVADITERRRAEELLEQHSGHLEELVKERTARLTQINNQLVKAIEEHKKTAVKLERSREQFRKLSAHLESAREEERRHIAREIHDELGQNLTILQMDLDLLERGIPGNDADSRTMITKMTKYLGQTIEKVQQIARELRPSLLDHLGIGAALKWQVNDFQKRTGIECGLSIRPGELDLPEAISVAVYRVVQEALTNILRHSQANHVEIALEKKGPRLHLSVRDNGVGIHPQQIADPNALGLMGMEERLHSLGGQIKITGRKGRGTVVKAKIPLE